MISDIEFYEMCKEAIYQWGETSQFLMVLEELNELAVVVAHGLRANKPFDIQDFITEMADVRIMLRQLQVMLKISDQQLIDEEQKKLKRLKELLETEK